jgi:hypothetical protein
MYLGSRARPLCKADNLTAIYEPILQCPDNVGSSTSHRPIHPAMGIDLLFLFYFYLEHNMQRGFSRK